MICLNELGNSKGNESKVPPCNPLYESDEKEKISMTLNSISQISSNNNVQELFYGDDNRDGNESAGHFIPNYLITQTRLDVTMDPRLTTHEKAAIGECKNQFSPHYKKLSMPGRSKSDGGLSYFSHRSWKSSCDAVHWFRNDFLPILPRSNATFRGVFVPTFQTIMNALFFVRCTEMVGSIGIAMSLVILFISGTIALLTSFSVCAIATNGTFPAGGAYYLISRSSGKEFGMAIGCLWYFCMTMGVAINILALVEFFHKSNLILTPIFWESQMWDRRLFGALVLFTCTIFCQISGLNAVSVLSIIFFALTLLCIFTLFLGGFFGPEQLLTNYRFSWDQMKENFMPKVETDRGGGGYATFMYWLSVFLPSIVGIMAGTNRSGLLANTGKSIPRGTMAALGVSWIIYFLFMVYVGGLASAQDLQEWEGAKVIKTLAFPHRCFGSLGMIVSALSASIQGIITAPRLLLAMAKDDVLSWLRPIVTKSKKQEPWKAIWITFLVSLIIVMIGDLNIVARITTALFATCYAFFNFTVAQLSILGASSWRPKWKLYHWSLSVIGGFACLVIIFMMSWPFALASVLAVAILVKYIEYEGSDRQWGDGLTGWLWTLAVRNVVALEEKGASMLVTRNWRPQIFLLISHNPNEIPQEMIKLASYLKTSHGLVIICCMVPSHECKKTARNSIQAYLKSSDIQAFVDVIVCNPGDSNCLRNVLETSGLGALRPNTVLLSYPLVDADAETLVRNILAIMELGKVVLLYKNGTFFGENQSDLEETPVPSEKGTIDVWWILHDGGLLLLLPFLLKKHKSWKKRQLRIYTIARLTDNSIVLEQELRALVNEKLRIEAEIEVVEWITVLSSLPSPLSLRGGQHNHQRVRQHFDNGIMEEQLKFTNANNTATTNDDDLRDFEISMTNTQRETLLKEIKVCPRQDVDSSRFRLLADERVQDSSTIIGFNQSQTQSHSYGIANNDTDNKRKNNTFEENIGAFQQRMNCYRRLNQLMRRHSSKSSFIFCNLPKPRPAEWTIQEYMDFLEALTKDLPPMLLVKGTGLEVVSAYY